MVQRGPQGTGVVPYRNMRVNNLSYAYDVVHDGIVDAVLTAVDIAGMSVNDTPVCPAEHGACVTSAAGGAISGADYLGQPITETVAAGGTTARAFMHVMDAPDDATWTNTYGLPYAYASGGAAGLTFTPPAADGDHRGTVTIDVQPATGTQVRLGYVPVAGNLHGDAYNAA